MLHHPLGDVGQLAIDRCQWPLNIVCARWSFAHTQHQWALATVSISIGCHSYHPFCSDAVVKPPRNNSTIERNILTKHITDCTQWQANREKKRGGCNAVLCVKMVCECLNQTRHAWHRESTQDASPRVMGELFAQRLLTPARTTTKALGIVSGRLRCLLLCQALAVDRKVYLVLGALFTNQVRGLKCPSVHLGEYTRRTVLHHHGSTYPL